MERKREGVRTHSSIDRARGGLSSRGSRMMSKTWIVLKKVNQKTLAAVPRVKSPIKNQGFTSIGL